MHHIGTALLQLLRRARQSSRLLLMLPLLAACSTAEISALADELLVATTDRAEYQRVGGIATVTVRLRNQGDHVVEVVGCPEPPAIQLEQRLAADWEPQFSQGLICPAVHLQRTTRIDPGGEIVGTLRIGSAGEFRARIFVGPPSTIALTTTVATPPFVVR